MCYFERALEYAGQVEKINKDNICFKQIYVCGMFMDGECFDGKEDHVWMSKDLLQKIKERIAGMDHWTDKQETRAAVDVLIRNVLYEEIPDSMFDRLEAYRKAIYEHIYTHYKQAA